MDTSENEKKQTDEQLRQLQELKCIGLIAGSIIHSFNNTIGVIHGYADLALRATSSSDRRHVYLKQIIEEAGRAVELSEKMRIFARQKKPDFQFVSIPPIVEQAIAILKESAPASIDIQQDIDAPGTVVFADADQIQQVVINLSNNAFEAMRENGGTLKINLKKINGKALERLSRGRYVNLTVSDTGPGMDSNVLKQMYEPFFTCHKGEGHAGLGLAVVHHIVSGHQGKILVESRLGEGTTFDVYLPLANKDREKRKS
jgi:signal transduction histidine kinase